MKCQKRRVRIKVRNEWEKRMGERRKSKTQSQQPEGPDRPDFAAIAAG